MSGKVRRFSWKEPKPQKTVGVCRYGAFGDLAQCASVIAGLKRQGYHTTLFSSPPGVDVVLHDPNIDRFILQDKDQVPNHLLGEFWDYWRNKFDKWVNLSESVEGTFLALPGRPNHEWPPALRHKMLNMNYVEFQHDLAGIPHDPQVHFYPTPTERAWAKKERSKMGNFVIVWSLSGSSVHKVNPTLDPIIARMMISYPDVHVVLVGGPDSAILEQGWENEPRVHLRCGKWTIRESLSFIEQADLIIGPETGVLNFAAQLPQPKIVFLSHSTEENLTRDWVNTTSIISENTTCPGRGNNEAPACHQLHYGWKFCKKTENGLAQCQEDIKPAEVFEAMQTSMHKYLEDKAA